MGIKKFLSENKTKRKEMRELSKAWKTRDKTQGAGGTSWLNPLGDHGSGAPLLSPLGDDTNRSRPLPEMHEYANPAELLNDLEQGEDKRFQYVEFSSIEKFGEGMNQPPQTLEETVEGLGDFEEHKEIIEKLLIKRVASPDEIPSFEVVDEDFGPVELDTSRYNTVPSYEIPHAMIALKGTPTNNIAAAIKWMGKK